MTKYVSIRLKIDGLMGIDKYNDDISASPIDITESIDFLLGEIGKMKELEFFLEEYGLNTLCAWKRDFEELRYLKEQIECAERYAENNNIKGTYYKECFDNLETIENERIRAERFYSKIPTRVKNFLSREDK
jgi:predicted nuclease with TOPRIM domain